MNMFLKGAGGMNSSFYEENWGEFNPGVEKNWKSYDKVQNQIDEAREIAEYMGKKVEMVLNRDQKVLKKFTEKLQKLGYGAFVGELRIECLEVKGGVTNQVEW